MLHHKAIIYASSLVAGPVVAETVCVGDLEKIVASALASALVILITEVTKKMRKK